MILDRQQSGSAGARGIADESRLNLSITKNAWAPLQPKKSNILRPKPYLYMNGRPSFTAFRWDWNMVYERIIL